MRGGGGQGWLPDRTPPRWRAWLALARGPWLIARILENGDDLPSAPDHFHDQAKACLTIISPGRGLSASPRLRGRSQDGATQKPD
jgi:hypothetical protein